MPLNRSESSQCTETGRQCGCADLLQARLPPHAGGFCCSFCAACSFLIVVQQACFLTGGQYQRLTEPDSLLQQLHMRFLGDRGVRQHLRTPLLVCLFNHLQVLVLLFFLLFCSNRWTLRPLVTATGSRSSSRTCAVCVWRSLVRLLLAVAFVTHPYRHSLHIMLLSFVKSVFISV